MDIEQVISNLKKVPAAITMSNEMALQIAKWLEIALEMNDELQDWRSGKLGYGDYKWILIDDKLPDNDSYILLSFSNYSVPIVGRYESYEDGSGNFFAGDEDIPLIKQDVIVNAWMRLPECMED